MLVFSSFDMAEPPLSMQLPCCRVFFTPSAIYGVSEHERHKLLGGACILSLIKYRENVRSATRLTDFTRTLGASHLAVRLFQHCERLRSFYRQKENQVGRKPRLTSRPQQVDQGQAV